MASEFGTIVLKRVFQRLGGRTIGRAVKVDYPALMERYMEWGVRESGRHGVVALLSQALLRTAHIDDLARQTVDALSSTGHFMATAAWRLPGDHRHLELASFHGQEPDRSFLELANETRRRQRVTTIAADGYHLHGLWAGSVGGVFVLKTRSLGLQIFDDQFLAELASMVSAAATRLSAPWTSRTSSQGLLLDRAGFMERLQGCLDNARGDTDVWCTVANIRALRDIHQGEGFSTGDRLVEAFVRKIGETVGPLMAAGRLGSERVVFASERDIRADDLPRQISIEETPYPLDAHLGLAAGPHQGWTAEELLRRALCASEAATQRREPSATYEAGMEVKGQLTQLVMRDFPDALARRELQLHFQPVFALDTMDIRGAEGLLRWTSPVHGHVSPAIFVPAAERLGMASALWSEVVRLAGTFLDEVATCTPDLRISLNVSASQFDNQALRSRFMHDLLLMSRHHDRLAIEVTETAAVRDIDVAARLLEEIRDLGVKVYLDDFGSGYASLSYARQLPFDILKIDRSFTADAPKRAAARSILRSLVQIARDCGGGVVAEGVETEEELTIVRDLGCLYAQGFMLARPQTADDFLNRLKAARQAAPAEDKT